MIFGESQSLSLKGQNSDLEEYKVSSNRVYSLRAIKNGRVGTAFSEATDQHSMVERVLNKATYANLESHETILANSDTLATDDLLMCSQEAI
jgi:PmbA protein